MRKLTRVGDDATRSATGQHKYSGILVNKCIFERDFVRTLVSKMHIVKRYHSLLCTKRTYRLY